MNRTVLMVEDNEDDVLLTRRALRKSGVDLTLEVVASATDAITFLTNREAALVLLDLRLAQGETGFTLLRWMRREERFARTPVVVLTSSSLDEDISSAYAEGANSYLVKPPDPDGMTRMADLVGRYWVETNRR